MTLDTIVDWGFLALAAFLAGVVDAVIGGGGMVQLPALFAIYPLAIPGALLGTNKLSSAIGTAGAALRYNGSVSAPLPVVVPAALVSFVAALLGAYSVLLVPAEPLRKALPFVLLVLLVYTLRSRVGIDHAPRHSQPIEIAVATSGSSVVGFYDGFLGAGTGAFYKLLFVRGLGYDFINAAAPSKFANVASNLGAVVVFGLGGHIHWGLALCMAAANFIGGQIGSVIALRYGSTFIRRALVAIVSFLILKTFHDAYLR